MQGWIDIAFIDGMCGVHICLGMYQIVFRMSCRLGVETFALFELRMRMFLTRRFTQTLLVLLNRVLFHQTLFAKHLAHLLPKFKLDRVLYTAKPQIIRILKLEPNMHSLALLQGRRIHSFEYDAEVVGVIGSPHDIIS